MPGQQGSQKEVAPLVSVGIRGLDRDFWANLNRRRGQLIDKLIAGTLTQDEEAKLKRLQAYADRHLDAFMEGREQVVEKRLSTAGTGRDRAYTGGVNFRFWSLK